MTQVSFPFILWVLLNIRIKTVKQLLLCQVNFFFLTMSTTKYLEEKKWSPNNWFTESNSNVGRGLSGIISPQSLSSYRKRI